MLFPSLSCNEFITHDEFLSISDSMGSSLGSFKNLLEETKQSKTKSIVVLSKHRRNDGFLAVGTSNNVFL